MTAVISSPSAFFFFYPSNYTGSLPSICIHQKISPAWGEIYESPRWRIRTSVRASIESFLLPYNSTTRDSSLFPEYRNTDWSQQIGSASLTVCTGFGLDRINVPQSSWYGAMFSICDENSVDNTGMFQLLLSSACTASSLL